MKLQLFACALLVMTAGVARAQQMQIKTSGGGGIPSPLGSVWSLLLREEVRKDLGLSDDVASKLRSLRDDYQTALQKEYGDAGINPREISNLTAEQRRKSSDIGKKIDDEFTSKAKELLTAVQNKRLQQIQLQYRLNLSAPTGLLHPDVAADLKLTDDQRQALLALRGEFVRNLFPRGGSNDKEAVEKNKQNQELVATKAIDVLTKEQKETLDKLKGSAFDFSNFQISVSASPAKTQPKNEAQQKDEGKIETGRLNPDFILALAAREAVQKDLGVSDEVAQKLMSMYPRDYQKAETKAVEEMGIVGLQARMQFQIREWRRYNAIVKKVQEDFLPHLQEVLTADQFQRLFQIQFQNKLNHDGPKTLLAPEFAADLKLTDNQKSQLDGLSNEFQRTNPQSPLQYINGRSPPFSMEASINHGKDFRTKAIELLTAEQKEALKKLEGEEFDLSPLVNKSRPTPPR